MHTSVRSERTLHGMLMYMHMHMDMDMDMHM